MSKKVAVVGGAGYVGSVLMKYLVKRKNGEFPYSSYDPYSFDRCIYGASPFNGYKEDIRWPQTKQFSDDCAAVINLAGLSNDPTAHAWPQLNRELNTVAAEDLLRFLAHNTDVKRYVFASSASLYDGCDTTFPVDETASLLDPDDMPPYSKSKLDAENRLRIVAAQTGMELVILRKGTIHGPSGRMRHDLIVNKLVGDALFKSEIEYHICEGVEMYRPIVDVRDVASAYEKALQIPMAAGETITFNICSENTMVSNIIADVVSFFDTPPAIKRVEIPPEKARSYKVSYRKAGKLLGWTPKFKLRDSIPDIIEFIKARGPERFFHPNTRNLDWMEIMVELQDGSDELGDFFDFHGTGK